MGDHVYYGKGGLNANREEAVEYYQIAADMRHSHAMFNLGLMYEVGDGVPQDFHLAKRYFDEAAATDRDAKMLGNIAVFLLQVCVDAVFVGNVCSRIDIYRALSVEIPWILFFLRRLLFCQLLRNLSSL